MVFHGKYIFASAFIIILLSACNDQGIITERDCPPNEKMYRDVPSHLADPDSLGDALTKFTNLKPLKNGISGREYRFWYPNKSSDESMLQIKEKNSVWSAAVSNFKYEYSNDYKVVVNITKTSNPVVPKSGWKQFSNKLAHFDIENLKDMSLIENYAMNFDGSWLMIEIGKCNYFKAVSFQNPVSMARSIGEIKRVVDLVIFLSYEFDIVMDV